MKNPAQEIKQKLSEMNQSLSSVMHLRHHFVGKHTSAIDEDDIYSDLIRLENQLNSVIDKLSRYQNCSYPTQKLSATQKVKDIPSPSPSSAK